MKFLAVPRLQKLSAMMNAVDVGDRIIHARVEAYSCKLAGSDKRAAKEISQAYDAGLHALAFLGPAAAQLQSPLGDLHDPATKHLLVSLCTTLNASFPDYDFSNLRPDDFKRDPSLQVAMDNINTLFLSAVSSGLPQPGFREEFWSALEETVQASECEIFHYEPSEDSDLNVGKLWTTNYFFFHRKLKKMLLLTAEALSKLHLQSTTSLAYHVWARRREEADSDVVADGDSDDEMMMDEEAAMLDEMEAEADAEGLEAGGDGSGAYVDVGLLEWDGVAPDEAHTSGLNDSAHSASHSHPLSPDSRATVRDSDSSLIYDSSPASTSSNASTVRLRAMQPVAMPEPVLSQQQAAQQQQQPQPVRLASTRSGGRVNSPSLQPQATTPRGSLSLFGAMTQSPAQGPVSSAVSIGGNGSSFSALPPPATSALPAVPTFTP